MFVVKSRRNGGTDLDETCILSFITERDTRSILHKNRLLVYRVPCEPSRGQQLVCYKIIKKSSGEWGDIIRFLYSNKLKR